MSRTTPSTRERTLDIFEKCHNCSLIQQADAAQAGGYYPYFIPIEQAEDTEVSINGRRLLMFGSNNYLGLTHHAKLLTAAERALKKYGTGCTGSRFLNGTLDLHEELEHRLARFVHKESALTFTTGYQTNLGTIQALVGRGDIVYVDKLDHASILDACRLSLGQVVRFRHNDAAHLEALCAKADPDAGKLIVVDGVFSMEGDIADLPRIIAVAQRYGCRVMVDDAHGLGVMGATGAGTAEHFGLEDRVDLIMGTFSKSFACVGGFIGGDADVIRYIKHHARSLIFSASMAPAVVATALAALDVIETEPQRRQQLWDNARRFRQALDDLGFDTGGSCTPVIPVMTGEDIPTVMFWKELFEAGVFTNPVLSPAVPQGAGRLRTSVMATHTASQLDAAIARFRDVGKQLKVI